MVDDFLAHHGIKGMKWGVRRYQNPDGTLTDLGRKKLGLSGTDHDDKFGDDYVIKKNTKAIRIGNTDFTFDPSREQQIDEKRQAEEKELATKYLSIIGVRNSGRIRGDEYYLSWFGDGGRTFDNTFADTYITSKDLKIASGKKVVDQLLNEYGKMGVKELLKKKHEVYGLGPISPYKEMALNYTRDKDLFNRVNKRIESMGYDGVEDINDTDSDMPIIVFNANKTVKQISHETANEYVKRTVKTAVDEYKKEHPATKLTDDEIAENLGYY